tara:strand:- start:1503 stop:1796 length:294 start_codon:yes stop_codon:yes gene_type:complete
LHTLDKVKSCLPFDHVNATRLVRVADTITAIRDKHHLRSESSTNELAATITTLSTLSTELLEHLGNSSTVLCVEIGINLVEEVEWCWVAFLDREDKR